MGFGCYMFATETTTATETVHLAFHHAAAAAKTMDCLACSDFNFEALVDKIHKLQTCLILIVITGGIFC